MNSKARDGEGRTRPITIGFRVTREQGAEIDEAVALSGLTKQDYITRKLTDRSVEVVPNSRVQRALSRQMARVYRELRRLERASEMGDDLRGAVALLAEVFAGLGEEVGPADTELEAASIVEMERA